MDWHAIDAIERIVMDWLYRAQRNMVFRRDGQDFESVRFDALHRVRWAVQLPVAPFYFYLPYRRQADIDFIVKACYEPPISGINCGESRYHHSTT